MTNTFDEIFGTVKELAEKAGKKTTELVDLSKIRLEIASINSDIKKSFEKLGSLTYSASKKDCDNTDLVNLCVAEIDALYARLDECKAKIDATKKVLRCPECGTANNIIATYCYVCGAKLAKEEPKPDAADETAAEEPSQTDGGAGTDGETPEN